MYRVFTNGPGDRGSNSRLSHSNDSKMVLDTSLLNTQQDKVRTKVKVEQSRVSRSAFPFTSVMELFKKEPSGLPRYGRQFYFYTQNISLDHEIPLSASCVFWAVYWTTQTVDDLLHISVIKYRFITFFEEGNFLQHLYGYENWTFLFRLLRVYSLVFSNVLTQLSVVEQ